jgi:methylenetetrahydrofolate reductase (NADPH)
MLTGLRFGDIFRHAQRPVIGFEVFPPKTDVGLARLIRILPGLSALHPDYMTVTYGAFGTTRVNTLEIASHILYRYTIPSACHLTCVGSSRAELDQILTRFHAAGIRNIVALRGDPPQGTTQFTPPPDGCAHANQLVEHIHGFTRRTGREPFGLAVAGYPEKHLEAVDLNADLEHLRRKVAAGAEAVVTQLFFDNACYYRFVEAARAKGITVPIVPGLMPVLSAAQIGRVTARCATFIPAELQAELAAAGNDEARAQEIGVRQMLAQAEDLLQHGAPGIHFYVLNQFELTRRIFEKLKR